MRTKILTLIFLNFLKLNAQVLEHFKYNGKDTAIIILPFDFHLPDTMVSVGKLRSGDPYLASSATYRPTYSNQLHILCTDAIRAGANVIQITDMTNVKWRNEYNIKGKAYKTKDIEAFKSKIFSKKDSIKKQMSNYATIVLYRPNYTQSFNDLSNYKLTINHDTLRPLRNTKFRVRVDKEGPTEIKIIGTNIIQTLNIKFGETYHVCTHADFPISGGTQINSVSVPLNGYIPRIEITETEKGEIESSLIKMAL